jgi:hypothetical protein
MYYTIESEGLRERWLFRQYQNACMAALELARRTPHEVWVVRIATPSGLGRQILCVYNCKYEVSANLPPMQVVEEDEEPPKRRVRRKRKK